MKRAARVILERAEPRLPTAVTCEQSRFENRNSKILLVPLLYMLDMMSCILYTLSYELVIEPISDFVSREERLDFPRRFARGFYPIFSQCFPALWRWAPQRRRRHGLIY